MVCKNCDHPKDFHFSEECRWKTAVAPYEETVYFGGYSSLSGAVTSDSVYHGCNCSIQNYKGLVMCAVSMIHDYFRENVSVGTWNTTTFTELKDIIERLDKLDHKLDQRECDDQSKAEWMKKVEESLKE